MAKRARPARTVRPPPSDARPKNRLLAGLPREDFNRIRTDLRTLPVAAKQVFFSPNEPIRDVIFLNGGVASVTTVMQDGRMIEVATVGDEGLVGMDAFFGGDTAIGGTMMQVPDTSAEFMPLAVFRRELDRRGPLFDRVQRYSRGLMMLMMHSAACVAAHQVQERCCRWLLMTHDRVRANQFQLSQEFLAMMLASTRPTVNVVASTLQKAGLIRYRHGYITILDRQGLEAGSCECYGSVRAQFDQLGL